jgi:enoyl-CoA hydratase
MTDSATLSITREGAVQTITLSRPDLLNRFDAALHAEFTQALTDAGDDAEVRAIVLASTGNAFSAGGDFELMRRAHADAMVRRGVVRDARRLFDALVRVPQPIVVALHGAAIGLGATVVLSCDAVVAARGAILADTHVNVGLVAGDGGCVVWPAAAGTMRARRHLLTGDPLDAETALQLGLITDLVDEPDDALPAALELARRIAALPPLAVQGTKRAISRLTEHRAGEVLDLSLAYEEATLGSDDLLEGVAAFQERRPANFTGR